MEEGHLIFDSDDGLTWSMKRWCGGRGGILLLRRLRGLGPYSGG
jgi:hypothetical protein